MKLENLVRYCSDLQIDNAIKNGEFCKIHRFDRSPEGLNEEDLYYAGQQKLIAELIICLQDKYGDRVFVSENVWPSELLKVEIGVKDVSKDTIATIVRFLLERRSLSCVNIVIYSGYLMDRGQYMGRMLIGGRGIVIEDGLREFMERLIGAES